MQVVNQARDFGEQKIGDSGLCEPKDHVAAALHGLGADLEELLMQLGQRAVLHIFPQGNGPHMAESVERLFREGLAGKIESRAGHAGQ